MFHTGESLCYALCYVVVFTFENAKNITKRKYCAIFEHENLNGNIHKIIFSCRFIIMFNNFDSHSEESENENIFRNLKLESHLPKNIVLFSSIKTL